MQNPTNLSEPKGITVKKILITLISLIFISLSANAETVYVTDNIKYTLRTTESNRSKIIRMLSSGTALTVISVNPDSGYTKVRTNSGAEGYILTRHTLNQPVSRWFLNEANKKLKSLQKKYDSIKAEFKQIKSKNKQTLSTHNSLVKERDKLSVELSELHHTAANAVQLKHQRDQLQERVITAERKLQQLKHKNQALEDSANQDWFLYGGLLSLFGVILGFVLPKLSWRRRRNQWDSF